VRWLAGETATEKLNAAPHAARATPRPSESTLGHNIESPLGPHSASDLDMDITDMSNSTHTDYLWTQGASASDALHSPRKSEASFERVDSASLTLLNSLESLSAMNGPGSSPTARKLEGDAAPNPGESEQNSRASFVPSLMLPAAESAAETVQGRHYPDSGGNLVTNLDSNEANKGANMNAKWRQDEQLRLNSARSAHSATDSVHSSTSARSGAQTVRRPNTAYSRMLHLKAPSRGSAGFEDYALQQRHETPILADSSGNLLMTSEHEWAWGLADYDAGTNFHNNSQHIATGGSAGGGSRQQLALRRPSVCVYSICVYVRAVSLCVCLSVRAYTYKLSLSRARFLSLSLSLTHTHTQKPRVAYTSRRGPRLRPACTGW
jgi:hypothetical protein